MRKSTREEWFEGWIAVGMLVLAGAAILFILVEVLR